jgi:hypothetical protein
VLQRDSSLPQLARGGLQAAVRCRQPARPPYVGRQLLLDSPVQGAQPISHITQPPALPDSPRCHGELSSRKCAPTFSLRPAFAWLSAVNAT